MNKYFFTQVSQSCKTDDVGVTSLVFNCTASTQWVNPPKFPLDPPLLHLL